MTNLAVDDETARLRRPAGIRSIRLGTTKVSFVPDGVVLLPPRGWLPDTTDEVWRAHPECTWTSRATWWRASAGCWWSTATARC
ncbi:hypothetical protein [Streptomyces actuosus]|uniref:hypothetical protein n=1 Tax=Streptomyces TaxID=1883 RepID=UPI003D2B49D9